MGLSGFGELSRFPFKKMAFDARRLRFTDKKSKHFYKDLNNFSTAMFFEDRSKRKVKNVDGGRLFEVERLISMRETKNKVCLYGLVNKLLI